MTLRRWLEDLSAYALVRAAAHALLRWPYLPLDAGLDILAALALLALNRWEADEEAWEEWDGAEWVRRDGRRRGLPGRLDGPLGGLPLCNGKVVWEADEASPAG